LIVAVAAGLVLGAASKLVDYVAPAWTGNSLAVWVLVAFLVGLRGRGWRDAATVGCTALVVANCTYYALRLFVIDNVSVPWAVRAFTFWTLLAVPAGLVAGALSGRGREGLALPAGAFAGEAVVTAAVGGRAAHVVVAALVAGSLGLGTSWTRRGVLLGVVACASVAAAVALKRTILN
jgi:hypothetical protein